jgi:hypothetical protein
MKLTGKDYRKMGKNTIIAILVLKEALLEKLLAENEDLRKALNEKESQETIYK